MSEHRDQEQIEQPTERERTLAAQLASDRPQLRRDAEERIRRQVVAVAAVRLRPPNLRSVVIAYGGCGALLLGLAALGAAHVGPLAF